MKILIAFYSLTGNTKKIANAIANAVEGKMMEIKTKKESPRGAIRYLWAGKQIIAKESPKLLPLEANPGEYDLIFLGTPVWAGNFAPAISSFLKQANLQNKKIALFAAHGGGPKKTFENLKKEISNNGIGNKIIGQIDFQMENIAPDIIRKNLEDASLWAKEIKKDYKKRQ